MSTVITPTEYVRWVKASLNRLLGTSLPDDGVTSPEYRMWVMAFQTNQSLPVTAQVNESTQNALIQLNRYIPDYVRWIQNALLISGEGIGGMGKNLIADGIWGTSTRDVVKDFQINHEGSLKVDGWVGAKTETFLMKRTGTIPPGRPGAKKPTPPPNPWGNLLTPTDRTENLAVLYLEELKSSSKTDRISQMTCLVTKLTKPGNSSFRYMDARDVNHFITSDLRSLLPLGPDGKPDTKAKMRLVVEHHVKRNLKDALVKHLDPWLKRHDMEAAYIQLKKKLNQLYDEVQEALNVIQFKFGSDPFYGQQVLPGALHSWAMELQQTSHMFSCFQQIAT